MKGNIKEKSLSKGELNQIGDLFLKLYSIKKGESRKLNWIYVPNQIKSWSADDLWIANYGSRKFLVRRSNIEGYERIYVAEIFLYND